MDANSVDDLDLISRKELAEEIENLRIRFVGTRSGKTMVNQIMEEYKKSILRIIDEQPTTNNRSMRYVPYTNVGRWIPVEERLPKEEMPVWITVKHSSWISDYGSDFIPKEEWMHHPESRGTHKGKYEEGIWWYEDEENEWIRCDEPGEERDLGVVYSTVIAWQPYTEPEPHQSNVPEANQNIAYQFFRNRFEGVK